MRLLARLGAIIVGFVVGALLARAILLDTIEQLALSLLVNDLWGVRERTNPLLFATSAVGMKLEIGAILGALGAAAAAERWLVPRITPAAPAEAGAWSFRREGVRAGIVVAFILVGLCLGLLAAGFRP